MKAESDSIYKQKSDITQHCNELEATKKPRTEIRTRSTPPLYFDPPSVGVLYPMDYERVHWERQQVRQLWERQGKKKVYNIQQELVELAVVERVVGAAVVEVDQRHMKGMQYEELGMKFQWEAK